MHGEILPQDGFERSIDRNKRGEPCSSVCSATVRVALAGRPAHCTAPTARYAGRAWRHRALGMPRAPGVILTQLNPPRHFVEARPIISPARLSRPPDHPARAATFPCKHTAMAAPAPAPAPASRSPIPTHTLPVRPPVTALFPHRCSRTAQAVETWERAAKVSFPGDARALMCALPASRAPPPPALRAHREGAALAKRPSPTVDECRRQRSLGCSALAPSWPATAHGLRQPRNTPRAATLVSWRRSTIATTPGREKKQPCLAHRAPTRPDRPNHADCIVSRRFACASLHA